MKETLPMGETLSQKHAEAVLRDACQAAGKEPEELDSYLAKQNNADVKVHACIYINLYQYQYDMQ